MMKYQLFATLLFIFSITEAKAQRPQGTDRKPNSAALVMLGDEAYFTGRFVEAGELYQKASEAGIDCEAQIRRVEKATIMLSTAKSIQIIDSIIVDKKYFFNYYKISDDAGRIFLTGFTADSLPLIGFENQRRNRQITTDTINGQSDIFIREKLFGGWDEKRAVAGDINSDANENFPFFMPDGITLYFCSDGEGSIGGFDIFVSSFSMESKFLLPENVGMPFNSPFNDYLMVIDEETKTGWFASDRYLEAGKVAVYRFVSE